VSSYRFCRTDDIGLLVGALNQCWAPHFPDRPPMTEAVFKRAIRDLQVWCSSCMVAFSGAAPIGVLIGAKRHSSTLVHTIAVHPGHLRQGHGRHLLDSLSSKLAILGPARILAEVPEEFAAACALFAAAGYAEEMRLTDYVLEDAACVASFTPYSGTGFVIPVSVDDLAANGLLEVDHVPVCWERSAETLTARKGELAGLAIATDEGIDAYLLHTPDGDIVALRSIVQDDGSRLGLLLSVLGARQPGSFRLRKVHPDEIPADLLERLGFRTAGVHVRFEARARAV
jgi:GNAT superfamily N-acetyltransferase